MNLYKIMLEHHSPKDRVEATVTYLVAESSESVYEWLKSEPEVSDHGKIYNAYSYSEKDDYEYTIYDVNYYVIGTEKFKERIIRLNGDMFDDEEDLDDLYYGRTRYGWKLVGENIDLIDACTSISKEIGIDIYYA